jgi:hypothetical protein
VAGVPLNSNSAPNTAQLHRILNGHLSAPTICEFTTSMLMGRVYSEDESRRSESHGGLVCYIYINGILGSKPQHMSTITAPTRRLISLYQYGLLRPVGAPRPFRRTWISTATRLSAAQTQTQTQTQRLPVTDKKRNGKCLDLLERLLLISSPFRKRFTTAGGCR